MAEGPRKDRFRGKIEYPALRRALNSEDKGGEDVTAAKNASSSSAAGGSELAANGGESGGGDTASTGGEKGTTSTIKDNPSDNRGGPAPKKVWSKFTKDMLGN